MSEWIWLNGETIPMAQASIGVEDRGFQFADGVYEVIRLYSGKPYTLAEHLARLERSAAGIELALPLAREQLAAQIVQFCKKVDAGEGMVYLQLTRGVAPRAHAFPQLLGLNNVKPTLLFHVRPLPALGPVGAEAGVKVITVPDERWQRCWIKSIALLPNILAKSHAVAAGADEAVFVDGQTITECSASNVHAIFGNTLVTHPVGKKVLGGITRDVLLGCASEAGLSVQERAWTLDEAQRADECFITSTTREISPIARWNDRAMPHTHGGPKTLALHRVLRQKIAADLQR